MERANIRINVSPTPQAQPSAAILYLMTLPVMPSTSPSRVVQILAFIVILARRKQQVRLNAAGAQSMRGVP